MADPSDGAPTERHDPGRAFVTVVIVVIGAGDG